MPCSSSPRLPLLAPLLPLVSFSSFSPSPGSFASSPPRQLNLKGIGLCREQGAVGWVPKGGRDGEQVGGPIHHCRQPLGQAFWGKPTSRNPLQRRGWDNLGPCLPAAQVTASLAPWARGMAEPRGATLPPSTAARWPSPLPWGPAWHGSVYCTTEGTVSWCHLCSWEQPSLSPKSYQGRLRCWSLSPPAVEQDITHMTQGRIWPTFPQCQRGPLRPDPQLPHSPTMGMGTRSTHGPHGTRHHSPSHTAPSTWHPPAACPAAPPPWHRLGGHCSRGGAMGDRARRAGQWGGGSVTLSPVLSALSCLLPAPL